MNYQDFLCAVEQELNKKLKEGIQASVYTARKNNGSEKQGIMIKADGVNAAPAIYLEELFERVLKGERIDRVVQEILDFYEEVDCRKVWDCSQFQKYENIRERVVFRLIHTEKNKKLLECIPFMEILDLSIVFYVLLEQDRNGTASIQISNEHLKMWGVQKEELYRAAVRNVTNLLPAEFYTMRHAIEEMLEVDSDEEDNLLEIQNDEKKDVMYVLTNSLRNYGAACLFYPHVLEMVGEMLKEDYYILPSSIHELIIVPESKALDADEMSEMVVEINETQVEPEEVLSDHAYFYQREEKKLMSMKKGDAWCGERR